MSKVSKKQLKSDLVYSRPSDGLMIRSNNNCWIHVVSRDQWDELSENFTDNNLRLGSHIECEIKENDIVLIYVKSNYTKNTGFVAIVQTCASIKKNDKKIKLYKNHNINKYLTNLETIILLPYIINHIELKDIIGQYNNKYKSFTHFTSSVLILNSPSTFVKLSTLDMGIKFIKYMLERHDKSNKITSDNEIIDNIYTNYDDDDVIEENDNNKCITIESDDIEDDAIDESDIEEDDIEYNDVKNEGIYDNEAIISNVPVMMIVCDKLRKVLKRLKLAKNKIQSVMDHYMYCQSCDITNNNRFELLMTYNRININTIKICQNNHKQALRAYLADTKYPSNATHEYIKIYLMQSDTFYTNDILIEFSSKLFPVIEITEHENK